MNYNNNLTKACSRNPWKLQGSQRDFNDSTRSTDTWYLNAFINILDSIHLCYKYRQHTGTLVKISRDFIKTDNSYWKRKPWYLFCEFPEGFSLFGGHFIQFSVGFLGWGLLSYHSFQEIIQILKTGNKLLTCVFSPFYCRTHQCWCS